MANTSATGGYLVPTSSQGLPGGLSLEDFLHTVIYGISGFTDKKLIRPKFQLNPPKAPDIEVNWIAFAVVNNTGDANAWVGMNPDETTTLQRQEALEIQLSFYGPNAQDNMALFRDGFQLQQNNDGLRAANMGFVGLSAGIRGPDLVNDRWRDRWETSLFLNRQRQRVYPVLAFVSAAGTIQTVIEDNLVTVPWQTPEET